MNLRKLIFTNNACYKAGRTIAVKGIMVHSTGANNPNLKRYVGPDDGLLGKNQYNNHWNQDKPGGRQVCVHAFIGKLANGSVATYQTLPWNHRKRQTARHTFVSGGLMITLLKKDLKNIWYRSDAHEFIQSLGHRRGKGIVCHPCVMRVRSIYRPCKLSGEPRGLSLKARKMLYDVSGIIKVKFPAVDFPLGIGQHKIQQKGAVPF